MNNNYYKNKKDIEARFDSLAVERQNWKNRNAYYYENQIKYIRFLIPEGLSILELGCGSGELLNALKPERGVGIDISSEMIESCRQKVSGS